MPQKVELALGDSEDQCILNGQMLSKDSDARGLTVGVINLSASGAHDFSLKAMLIMSPDSMAVSLHL